MPRPKPYHHTNLRAALLQAAIDVTRTSGPEQVSLRDLARHAGVSAPAAYRHFESYQALMEEVKRYALTLLAERIAQALDSFTPSSAAAQTVATERLRVIWDGYISFAIHETGLFKAALDSHITPQVMPEVVNDQAYAMLGDAVDALFATSEKRAHPNKQYAQLYIWAAMHGLAELYMHGPLANLSDTERQELSTFAFEATCRGVWHDGATTN